MLEDLNISLNHKNAIFLTIIKLFITQRVLVESGAFVQKILLTDRAKKASYPISIISNDVFIFQLAQFAL